MGERERRAIFETIETPSHREISIRSAPSAVSSLRSCQDLTFPSGRVSSWPTRRSFVVRSVGRLAVGTSQQVRPKASIVADACQRQPGFDPTESKHDILGTAGERKEASWEIPERSSAVRLGNRNRRGAITRFRTYSGKVW